MMRRIGGAFNVQHVILVGGGAFVFERALKQTFSTHQILDVKEPMFANVRGYRVGRLEDLRDASMRARRACAYRSVCPDRPGR